MVITSDRLACGREIHVPHRALLAVFVSSDFHSVVSANDCIEPLAANTPSYAAGRYRESAPTPGSLSGSWPNSMIESPSASLTMHSGNSRMRRCFNAAFDVLPHRSQITRGGGPSRSTIFAKSASFVMTAAPAARAAAKIGGSRASRSPRSRAEAHSTAKVPAIHRAIAGER